MVARSPVRRTRTISTFSLGTSSWNSPITRRRRSWSSWKRRRSTSLRSKTSSGNQEQSMLILPKKQADICLNIWLNLTVTKPSSETLKYICYFIRIHLVDSLFFQVLSNKKYKSNIFLILMNTTFSFDSENTFERTDLPVASLK